MTRRAHGALAGALLTLVLLIAGCGSASSPERRTALGDSSVTVGSFDFPESELLAELYSQSLETHGIDVRRAFNLGPRELVAPALLQGLVELIPEYAGTAVQYHGLADELLTPDVDATHQHLVTALAATDVRALRAPRAAGREHLRRHTSHRRSVRAPRDQRSRARCAPA